MDIDMRRLLLRGTCALSWQNLRKDQTTQARPPAKDTRAAANRPFFTRADDHSFTFRTFVKILKRGFDARNIRGFVRDAACADECEIVRR